MSLQVVVVAVLSLVAAGAHALPSNLPSYHAPAPSYHAPRPTYAPKPSYAPRPSYHAPAQYADAHPQYNSQYAVKDDYAGLNFGAQEARDGYDTQGSYSVLLPDGRLQTVTYYVNGDSGYVAEVTYEGEAQYPAQGYGHKPSYGHAPTPSYSPRPSYGYFPKPSYGHH
ncbi:cuticle protein 7-like isoform X1 [Eriocheir sinensis]|uniref:cuticle protein 7-like isoform X1 n=1 Tax=Eriocheir sinensis TaxID=95602 RepID=UPI0021C94AB3|nr:cuticle protein 7-like isoform X1 [Eriocheir sinensis]